MNSNYLKKLLFSMSLVLMFASVGYCEKIIPDANDLFRKGDYKDIEVIQPKPGFVGAVPTPSARIYPNRIPSSNEDFLTRYVRITVIEKIELKKGIRVVFQLDQIDPNGAPVAAIGKGGYHEPIYYAYLDVTSDGCKIEESIEAVHNSPMYNPEEHIIQGISSRRIRSGIRFPLRSTFPPVLNPQENYKDNSWMHGDSGSGIVYTDAAVLNAPNYMRINAYQIQKVYPSLEVRQEDIRYYSDSDKSLSSAKTPDCIEVVVLQKETQLWDRSDDWLWLELERTDNAGNIIMRCRKLKTK